MYKLASYNSKMGQIPEYLGYKLNVTTTFPLTQRHEGVSHQMPYINCSIEI